MEGLKTSISMKSRIAKLWLRYIDYMDIVWQYIRAARTGDWNLGLITLQRMINLFAATGHINYAKSSRFYLQLMMDLHSTHPWLHKKLAEECPHFNWI